MKRNLSRTDRMWRLLLALTCLSLAIWQSSWLLAAIGTFILVEVGCSWCVIYQMMGKNNCPIDQKKR
jgi:hypothetical protein